MSHLLHWVAALAPALLLVPGLIPAARADAEPGRVRLLALRMGLAAFALAAFVALALAWTGRALPGPIVQLDAVSAAMFLLVSGIGAIVLHYSVRYLDGDPGQGRFFKWLCLTIAAVLALVISGNLILLAACWIATGYGLHRLLLFYPERAGAQLAARKMRLASHVADAALVLAVVLAAQALGSLTIAGIQANARAMLASGEGSAAITLAALLLVLSAVIKSAQFPAHGWLAEVMETPTPVSALLHAGIINAGGFLIVRLADIVALSGASLDLLLLIGAVSAVFGAAVMLTQTSVKVNLAYSTVAQMGFMTMQLGLSAFAAALLHVFAHGLYKAHAFLSAGGVAQTRRPERLPRLPMRVLLPSLLAAVLLVLLVGAALGMPLTSAPGPAVLGAILVMSIVPTLATAALESGRPAFALRAVAIAAGVAVAWFGLQAGAAALLAPALPPVTAPRGLLAPAIAILAVLAFAGLLVLNVWRRQADPDGAAGALYVHLVNGLYVNSAANARLAGKERN
jgi:NAD(P)H-quinone oxidoreductase subunit 5